MGYLKLQWLNLWYLTAVSTRKVLQNGTDWYKKTGTVDKL